MTTNTAAETRQSREQALTELRDLLPAGATITTVSRHSSAATTWISPMIVRDGRIYDLTWLVAKAGLFARDHRHEGLKSGGYGLSRSFSVVYDLGRAVFPNGVQCTGKGCNSNEHFNGDRDYSGRTVHSDGGYAFIHESA